MDDDECNGRHAGLPTAERVHAKSSLPTPPDSPFDDAALHTPPDARLTRHDDRTSSTSTSPIAVGGQCGAAEMSRSPSTSSVSSSTDDDEKVIDRKVPPQQRVSIYVQVFEEMLQTVLEKESYLFDDDEIDLIKRFSAMSYEARYLFVRLFSRKNGWFRVSKLAYFDEIGDMGKAVEELCSVGRSDATLDTLNTSQGSETDEKNAAETEPVAGPSTAIMIPSSPLLPHDGVMVIDSDTDQEVKTAVIDRKGKSRATDPLSDRPLNQVHRDLRDFGLSRFAISETVLAQRSDVDELLSMLSLDELKALAKDVRVASGKTTRSALIEAVKTFASSQSTLSSMFAAGAARNEALKARRRRSQDGRTAIPAADHFVGRITVARQTEILIQRILSHLGPCIKLEAGPIRLFARLHLLYYRSVTYSEKTLTQAVLSRFKIRNYPTYAVKRSFSIFESRQALIDYEEALIVERRMEELLGEAMDPSKGRSTRKFTKDDRERGFQEGYELFKQIYPRWKQLVAEAQVKDAESRKLVKNEEGDLVEDKHAIDDRLTYYRKRFLCGWPLTRVVYKGASILARLHRYDEEVEVLCALLGQTCFRRGKRGEWYDRLALVLMNHFSEDKEQRRREALAVCEEALAHPWTHLIYHNSLQRRIVRLESALDVPPEDRHPPVPGLRAARKRVMQGEKLSEGETGKKSVWRSMNGAEVSVEELSLECYVREGWKGFHSENGILTTIFALLFWDVIFHPVDGVFETAYQSGPLDLSTDAFAIIRAELVQARLEAILDGKAYDILLEADLRERDNKTWCVGLRWAYEREDLLEIVQALATICRVYAEEWSHRTGGVPDLFIWNFEKRVARLVEVKGPGDILSETQKVWIDVLLSAGVEVELCSVRQIFEEDDLSLSEDERKRLTPLRRKRSSSSTSKNNKRPLSLDPEEDGDNLADGAKMIKANEEAKARARPSQSITPEKVKIKREVSGTRTTTTTTTSKTSVAPVRGRNEAEQDDDDGAALGDDHKKVSSDPIPIPKRRKNEPVPVSSSSSRAAKAAKHRRTAARRSATTPADAILLSD